MYERGHTVLSALLCRGSAAVLTSCVFERAVAVDCADGEEVDLRQLGRQQDRNRVVVACKNPDKINTSVILLSKFVGAPLGLLSRLVVEPSSLGPARPRRPPYELGLTRVAVKPDVHGLVDGHDRSIQVVVFSRGRERKVGLVRIDIRECG